MQNYQSQNKKLIAAAVMENNGKVLIAQRAKKGAITLIEHSAIAWVNPSELSNYDMPEPDLPVVKLLQNSN